MGDFELLPRTDVGRKYVELAEQHAAEIAARAEQHDREGSFPAEAFEAMKASGLITAAVSQEFGGMGVSSLHDLMVGLNRLGRADGSIAIALNMHYAVSAVIGRMARGARANAVTRKQLRDWSSSLPRSGPARSRWRMRPSQAQMCGTR